MPSSRSSPVEAHHPARFVDRRVERWVDSVRPEDFNQPRRSIERPSSILSLNLDSGGAELVQDFVESLSSSRNGGQAGDGNYGYNPGHRHRDAPCSPVVLAASGTICARWGAKSIGADCTEQNGRPARCSLSERPAGLLNSVLYNTAKPSRRLLLPRQHQEARETVSTHHGSVP